MVANELLEASSEEADSDDEKVLANSLKPAISTNLEEAYLDDKY